jgi:hypothetical protein
MPEPGGIGKMERGYAETMLWATTKYDEYENCDKSYEYLNYSADDLSKEAWRQIREDCEGFLELVREDEPAAWEELVLDLERAGHDFFLTRERHGAGFWDGDWVNGTLLTKWSHTFGTVNLYVNDNGEIEIQ